MGVENPLAKYIWAKIKDSLSIRYILFLATPVLVSIIFLSGSFNFSGPSVRLFLSALVTAQVSLLSIVFALLILGFNLISDKYGIRTNQLIRRNPLFWITGIVFLSSVSLNLVSLLTLNQTAGFFWKALAGFSIGMTADAIVFLFLFVNSALKQTQPKEVISLVENDNQADMILAKMERNKDDIADSAAFHPLYPLYRIAINSLERNDLATAKLAVRSMKNHTIEVIEELERADKFPEENSDIARQFINPIANQFLPEIAFEYVHEDFEVSKESVETILKISKELVDIQTGYLAFQANRGFETIIRDGLRREDVQNLVNKSMRAKIDFVEYWVDEEGFDPEDESQVSRIERVISQLGKWRKFPILEGSGRSKYSPSYLHFTSRYPLILESTLSKISSHSVNADFRWYEWNNVADEDGEVDPYLDLVKATIGTAKDYLSQVMEYKDRNNTYPLAEGNFYDFFEDICNLSEEVSHENRKAFWILAIEYSAQFYYLFENEFSDHLFRELRDAGQENPDIMHDAIEDAIKYSEGGERLYYARNPRWRATSDGVYYTTADSLADRLLSGKTRYDEWLAGLEKSLSEKI